MSEFSLQEIVRVGNTLGECILWDERTGCIWWTDIHGSRLYRYTLAGAKLREFTVPGRLCSFGFVEDDARLVCAFAQGIGLHLPGTTEVEWLFQPERGCRGTRFNDGRVDRQGRFWAGTMVESAPATDADGKPLAGSLYWVSRDGSGRAFGNIGIPNSICWSRAGDRMYFADSTQGCINAYEFDAAAGTVGAGRVFAESAAGCSPDGAIVDADDCVWNAQWGGGKVLRYAPDGSVLTALELPVSQPACQCFGGPQLDLLIVSTARENLDAARLRAEPEAGNVFIYRTPYRGLPESRYRL